MLRNQTQNRWKCTAHTSECCRVFQPRSLAGGGSDRADHSAVCVISPELLCVAACSLLIRTHRALRWVVNVVTSRHPPAVSVGGASFRWSLQQNHRYPRRCWRTKARAWNIPGSRFWTSPEPCGSGGSTGLWCTRHNAAARCTRVHTSLGSFRATFFCNRGSTSEEPLPPWLWTAEALGGMHCTSQITTQDLYSGQCNVQTTPTPVHTTDSFTLGTLHAFGTTGAEVNWPFSDSPELDSFLLKLWIDNHARLAR